MAVTYDDISGRPHVERRVSPGILVALAAYSFFTFIIAATNRERIKLVLSMILAGVFAVGVLAAAQSIPQVAEL